MAERSCPPYSLGQVIPSQPRSPSFFEKDGSTPDSQVSTCVSNDPAASSAARNSRTSMRTCSAACDRGAGVNVSELLMSVPHVDVARLYRAGRHSAHPGARSGSCDPAGPAALAPRVRDLFDENDDVHRANHLMD